MVTRLTVPGDDIGPSRTVLVRDAEAAPNRVRVWFHGGGQGPGGSNRMERRIPAEPHAVDYFPEGIPHTGYDGAVTTGWIRIDGQAVPEGLDPYVDVRYTLAVLDMIAAAHPGLPIYLGGYSSGAMFLMSCLHAGVVLSDGIAGVALVKATPTFDWLTSEPDLADRAFDAPAFPARAVVWYALGDDQANQDPAMGHLTFIEAIAVWINTLAPVPTGTSQTVLNCESITDIERFEVRDEGLMVALERAGSHTSSFGCIGRYSDAFLRGPSTER